MAQAPKLSSDTARPVLPNSRYGMSPTRLTTRGVPTSIFDFRFICDNPTAAAAAAARPPPRSQRRSNVFIRPRQPPTGRKAPRAHRGLLHEETRAFISQFETRSRQGALDAPESAEHDARGLHLE